MRPSILPVWQFGGNPINFPDSLRRKLDAGFQNVFGISLDSALTEVRHPDDLTLVALQDKRKSDFAFSVLTYGRINAGTYKEGDTLSLQLTRIGEDPDDSRGFHILDRDIMAQQQYVIVAIRSLADDGKAYNQLDTPSDTLQTSASDSTAFQGEETYGIDTDKRQEFAAEATGLLTKEPLQHYAIAIMIPNHTDGVTFNVNQSNDHTGAAVIGTLDVEKCALLVKCQQAGHGRSWKSSSRFCIASDQAQILTANLYPLEIKIRICYFKLRRHIERRVLIEFKKDASCKIASNFCFALLCY